MNVRYVYDGARRRVLKVGTGGATRFVYDQADHLIFEVGPDGSKRNYVWLGDIPLAVIDQNSAGAKTAAYFVETDFANTPRYLRRAAGDLTKVVWYWQMSPYGESAANVDGDGARVVFNLRYPGQYYDSESKLHYNHTRYFQPRTGRYLQPDLIGLEGGTNVYTYAGGNPVMFMDPTGTFWESSDGSPSDGGLMSMIGSFFSSALSMFENWAGGTIGQGMERVDQGMITADAFFDLPQSSVPFMPAMALNLFGAAGAEEMTVYRVFGGDARAEGYSWTATHPNSVNDFRNLAGLPSGGSSGATNTAEFMLEGRVKTSNIINSRPALPLDGNAGGLSEYIINPKKVRITDFSVLKP